MIVSDNLIPGSRGNRLDTVTGKILEIQQEILLINKHRNEHITDKGEIRQPDSSCSYCQRRYNAMNETSAQSVTMIGQQEENKKSMATLTEMERRVEVSGKNCCVIVPRTWQGKRVRIVLLDEV